MWTCPKCREEVDDELEVCWACGTTVEGVEDPHFFDEPSERRVIEVPENLVTVTKHLLGPEAHAMRSRLEAEGIPAFIFNEMSTTVGLLSNTASEGAELKVPDYCLERAREILGIMEEEQEPVEEPAEAGDEAELGDQDQDESEEARGDDEEPTSEEPPPEEGITEH